MTSAGSGLTPATAASPAALTPGPALPTVSPVLPALVQVSTAPCCWWGMSSPSHLLGRSARSARGFAKRGAARAVNLGYSAGTQSA